MTRKSPLSTCRRHRQEGVLEWSVTNKNKTNKQTNTKKPPKKPNPTTTKTPLHNNKTNNNKTNKQSVLRKIVDAAPPPPPPSPPSPYYKVHVLTAPRAIGGHCFPKYLKSNLTRVTNVAAVAPTYVIVVSWLLDIPATF